MVSAQTSPMPEVPSPITGMVAPCADNVGMLIANFASLWGAHHNGWLGRHKPLPPGDHPIKRDRRRHHQQHNDCERGSLSEPAAEPEAPDDDRKCDVVGSR